MPFFAVVCGEMVRCLESVDARHAAEFALLDYVLTENDQGRGAKLWSEVLVHEAGTNQIIELDTSEVARKAGGLRRLDDLNSN